MFDFFMSLSTVIWLMQHPAAIAAIIAAAALLVYLLIRLGSGRRRS